MTTLEKSLRNHLERIVKEARDVAESASRASLDQLGVGDGAPPDHLTPSGKKLRRALRTHGHQLGDERDNKKGGQQIDRLAEEVAFEHWHRMLFARFLAENNLLMYPDPHQPVAVSLQECEDLAIDEGARNGWELAARFAARMLPQIFRVDSPVLSRALAPEDQQRLEKLLSELPQEVFQASDSLGWVYQFWQSRRKQEVNDSEAKIGAREISAVTQLFTEDYMVQFLLDNTLGAWWAGRRLSLADLHNAASESELRGRVRLPNVAFDYLRFARTKDDGWQLAAGAFRGWPRTLAELKLIDPSCGSGHFLVSAFGMLVEMRVEEERLSVAEAVDAVLRDNLFGLEIDARCTQIAAFNLAFTAWRMAGYRKLPPMNIACTGLSVGGTRDEWMKILEGQKVPQLRFYFGQLYDLFSKAASLGSLINPHRYLGSGTLDESGTKALENALVEAISEEPDSSSELHEMGVAAQGIARACQLLSERYTLVITNVPYLGRNRQDEVLKKHLEQQYPLGKADLAAAFVLRCLEFCQVNGSMALVTPQNWLFLTTYAKLREMLLDRREWNLVARLGAGAFETIGGQVVNVALSTITASVPEVNHRMAMIDVSAGRQPDEKALMLCEDGHAILIPQEDQLKNPDAVIGRHTRSEVALLSEYADCIQGFGTSDDNQFMVCFWETRPGDKDWVLTQTAPQKTQLFTGRLYSLLWEGGEGRYAEFSKLLQMEGRSTRWRSGSVGWGKQGISISEMSSMPATLFNGDMYDNTAHVIIPKVQGLREAIWCFIESGSHLEALRQNHPGLKVSNHVVLKVPFDRDHWQSAAALKYPNGLPDPESDDVTQWLFHGRPERSTSPLQCAVSRLMGYQWPAELSESMCLSVRARKLAASSGSLSALADKDGIVCIPPVRGEVGAADRLLNLLAAAYGNEWSSDVLGRLLSDADYAGKSLEAWLRDGFFQQHCELFHQRPFVWQVWDGLRDGFSALINYHRLDRKNLETLIYTYLGDWIIRCEAQDKDSGLTEDGEKTTAAKNLKRKLELILEGEAPYDIFVRWKPLHQQPIGWEPDINDGVRLNIRPFVSVPDVKAKGAGVLRVKPKIKWDKDRGKEPQRSGEDFPWFWGWDESVDFEGGEEFLGEKVNDCHYRIEFKEAARRDSMRSVR